MTEQTLAELLASLPEEERVILTLFYLRSFSVTQIAVTLAVPERAVLVIINSGRSHLTKGIGI